MPAEGRHENLFLSFHSFCFPSVLIFFNFAIEMKLRTYQVNGSLPTGQKYSGELSVKTRAVYQFRWSVEQITTALIENSDIVGCLYPGKSGQDAGGELRNHVQGSGWQMRVWGVDQSGTEAHPEREKGKDIAGEYKSAAQT